MLEKKIGLKICDVVVPIKIRKFKKKDPLESSIQEKILDFLNAIPECKALNRHLSGWTGKGESDLHGCIKGRNFEIEVKRPKEDLTLLQKIRQREWKAVGSITGRAESIDCVRKILRDHGYDI